MTNSVTKYKRELGHFDGNEAFDPSEEWDQTFPDSLEKAEGREFPLKCYCECREVQAHEKGVVV